jgi:hypothetical protein
LITLSKKSPQDHDVLRCQECGFLFSPAGGARVRPGGGDQDRPGARPSGSLDAGASGRLGSTEASPTNEGC